jgi:hypothetical protein
MLLATGSLKLAKTIGISASPAGGNSRGGRLCHDDVGLQADQFLRESAYLIGIIAVPPKVHPHVAATCPTQVRKRLSERRDASPIHGIVFATRYEHADAPDALALRSR